MKAERFLPTSTVSSWVPTNPPILEYDVLNFTVSGNLTIRGNGTTLASIFKTSGAFSWDNQAYISTGYVAPCTIEFNKMAVANYDNTMSYAMIGWNNDPTTDASYTSLNYASYPFQGNAYYVYHNGSALVSSGTWSRLSKFYIVYGTDGFIRHYNGSTQLYSVNYGTGQTVYLDSSFYSPAAMFGGFSNIRIIKRAWNGTSYG